MPDLDAALRWFETHTVGAEAPAVHELVRIRGGQRISVILPAKDEASTVGTIVESLRADLVDAVPLVHEVVVIDSHSSDDTARIARDAGARVLHVDDILPQLGARPGKGEALWRALAVMRGDIGVFLDADVADFSSGFATGLLGPLLRDDRIVLSKGFYDRPWTGDGRPAPTGGGRVTELVARPLILDRAPALAGFVQPLAGEFAFRREPLLDLPFVSDYGVDIGLLLDVLRVHGLDAMAQVDLGERVHPHQDLAALSDMTQHVRAAFELCASDLDHVVHEVVGFVRSGTEMRPHRHDVTTFRRPPMRSLL